MQIDRSKGEQFAMKEQLVLDLADEVMQTLLDDNCVLAWRYSSSYVFEVCFPQTHVSSHSGKAACKGVSNCRLNH